jgi:ribosomal-protein-alanine N-acetyltransferase
MRTELNLKNALFMGIPFINQVTIRTASSQDCDRIQSIEQAASPFPLSHDSIAQELNNSNGCNFVALLEDQGLCGFIFSVLIADEISILHLATLPPFRRRGIARRLLETTLEEALKRGAENTYLEVRSKNFPAIGLYEKLGFHRQSVRKKYYCNDNDDAVIMHKRM